MHSAWISGPSSKGHGRQDRRVLGRQRKMLCHCTALSLSCRRFWRPRPVHGSLLAECSAAAPCTLVTRAHSGIARIFFNTRFETWPHGCCSRHTNAACEASCRYSCRRYGMCVFWTSLPPSRTSRARPACSVVTEAGQRSKCAQHRLSASASGSAVDTFLLPLRW